MLSLPIGFVFTIAIVYFSLEGGSISTYVNSHSLVLVFAGTVAIFIMSTPFDTIRRLVTALRELFSSPRKVEHFRGEFEELNQSRSTSIPSNNELIRYATDLWSSGVQPELFVVLVLQKREELERANNDVIQSLRNLAKYPPVLGMTGTVMGLVTMFSNLGSNQTTIGPALAFAMTATFWGLITANCLVTPLADHLHVKQLQREKLYGGIYQILMLIHRGEASVLIRNEVDEHVA